MIEEEGVVVSLQGDLARVRTQRSATCESCASISFCEGEGQGRAEVQALNVPRARVGDRVRIAIRPQVFLRGSLLLYGVPLVAMVVAAILGKTLAQAVFPSHDPDLWAFAAAMISLLGSFFMMRRYNERLRHDSTYRPVVCEILKPASRDTLQGAPAKGREDQCDEEASGFGMSQPTNFVETPEKT